jgi:fructokinase
MKKIIGIGELLIDMMPSEKGKRLKDVTGFTKKAGGAPANVCVAAANLFCPSIFLGQVGKDAFGDYLVDELNHYGVDTLYLEQTTQANTCLAFVTLSSDGERDFIFYRNPSADQLYTGPSDLSILDHQILHFCSVSLLGDYPMVKTHKRLLDYAKSHDTIISFDPNIRLALSDDHSHYKQTIQAYLHYADILKIGIDELEFITDQSTYIDQIQFLKQFSWRILVITLGKDGVHLYTQKEDMIISGFEVSVKDTTGAGDAWIGSFLAQCAKHDTLPTDITILQEYAKVSNGFAALTTTKLGAMDAMPTQIELNDFLHEKDLKK